MSCKKGFTLLELIIVIIIMAILVAIALTSYNSFLQQGMSQAALNNTITIAHAQQNYYFTQGQGYYASGSSINVLDKSFNLTIQDSSFNYTCTATIPNNPPKVQCTIQNQNKTVTFSLNSQPGSLGHFTISCIGNNCPASCSEVSNLCSTF